MWSWLSNTVKQEMRSFGTIAFFLVLVMTIGSAASWFEGGAARYAASHTVQAATASNTVSTSSPSR